jgi:hypothetical protein
MNGYVYPKGIVVFDDEIEDSLAHNYKTPALLLTAPKPAASLNNNDHYPHESQPKSIPKSVELSIRDRQVEPLSDLNVGKSNSRFSKNSNIPSNNTKVENGIFRNNHQSNSQNHIQKLTPLDTKNAKLLSTVEDPISSNCIANETAHHCQNQIQEQSYLSTSVAQNQQNQIQNQNIATIQILMNQHINNITHDKFNVNNSDLIFDEEILKIIMPPLASTQLYPPENIPTTTMHHLHGPTPAVSSNRTPTTAEAGRQFQINQKKQKKLEKRALNLQRKIKILTYPHILTFFVVLVFAWMFSLVPLFGSAVSSHLVHLFIDCSCHVLLSLCRLIGQKMKIC